MELFDWPTCLILFKVDNTIFNITGINETTALQFSRLVDIGFIHGC